MDRLKRKIENNFGLTIKKWKVVKDVKQSSFVARLVSKKGKKYALKSLFNTPERQYFISKSEQLLARKGVKLAPPVPARKGNLYIVSSGAPYVLYPWIKGSGARLRNRDDLCSIVQVIARMHRRSRKLYYPSDVIVDLPPDWREQYKERIESIRQWYESHQSSEDPKHVILSRHLPFFLKMAVKAKNELKGMGYGDKKKGIACIKTLVHGDLHQNNLIVQKDHKVLIDFEDVRYDAPSKDLIRIYSMYTRKHPFSKKDFRAMMKTYERHHRLSSYIRQLIYIDFLFPHIIERMLRKEKYDEMSDVQLLTEIQAEKRKARYVYRRYFRQ